MTPTRTPATARHATAPGSAHAEASPAGDPPAVLPPGAVGAQLLWFEGRWRPVRVADRDGWVTVEEAARAARRATAVVRERARRPGVPRLGEGRPGNPYRYRLSDLCPEVAVSARLRPSPGPTAVTGTSGSPRLVVASDGV